MYVYMYLCPVLSL